MKLKSGLTCHKIADAYVIVPYGETSKQFNKIIQFNETGAFMWNEAEKNCNKAAISEALIKEYGIEKELADSQAAAFIEQLTEAGCIEL